MALQSRILGDGEALGGYRVEGVIGLGGMAIVYRAEHISLGRHVALKVLAPQLSHDEAFRERFRHEGKHIAALDHPNVVPVYDSGEIDGCLYLAMRLVEGETLATRMQREGLAADETLELLSPIAGALDAAHAVGIVHRDVKPQNILISTTGHPYLADFGVAKAATAKSGLTAAGGFIGSIDYASPEQVRGENTSPAGDIYALTAVLFQCLSGQVPYPRDADWRVMEAHLNEPPPSLGPGARELDLVVARGMAKSPSERYASAGRLMSDAASALATLAPAGRLAAPQLTLNKSAVLGRARTRAASPVPPDRDQTPPTVERVAANEPQVSPPRPIGESAGLPNAAGAGNEAPPRSPKTSGCPFEGTERGKRTEIASAGQSRARRLKSDPTATNVRAASDRNQSSPPDAGSTSSSRFWTAAAIAASAAIAIFVAIAFLGSARRSRADMALKLPSGAGSGGLPTLATRRTDNTVWYLKPGLRGWTATGRFASAGTPAIAEAGGHTVIAARSARDGTIWYTIPGVQSWRSTGTRTQFIASSDPAVAVDSRGHVTIVDRGTNNNVWYVQPGAPVPREANPWKPTYRFTAAGNPSIAEGHGQIVIAARGARDGTIWYTTPGAPRWTPTGSYWIGSSDPAVALSSTGQITIADRGTDNTVWYVQPGVKPWKPTYRFIAAGNPAIADGDGRVVLAARGARDGTIWYTTPGAPRWTSTGHQFIGSSDPTVAISSTGQIAIADVGADSTVFYVEPGKRSWTSTGNLMTAGDL